MVIFGQVFWIWYSVQSQLLPFVVKLQLGIVFNVTQTFSVYDSITFLFIFYRKAMRAVGVLFCFLGFSNFIFFYNHQDQGFWEAAYLLTNSISQSSQVTYEYCTRVGPILQNQKIWSRKCKNLRLRKVRSRLKPKLR